MKNGASPLTKSGVAHQESKLTLFSLVSFAARVEMKTSGLQDTGMRTQTPRTQQINAYYVAVIARMPPAAPATEWMKESLGIVGRKFNWDCQLELGRLGSVTPLRGLLFRICPPRIQD